jgi:hypothetical protein
MSLRAWTTRSSTSAEIACGFECGRRDFSSTARTSWSAARKRFTHARPGRSADAELPAEDRLHQALGDAPPALVYRGSPRGYPRKLLKPDPPSSREACEVDRNGCIRWHKHKLSVTSALSAEIVELERIGETTLAHSGRDTYQPPAGTAAADLVAQWFDPPAGPGMVPCGDRAGRPPQLPAPRLDRRRLEVLPAQQRELFSPPATATARCAFPAAGT